ncbi:MAG: NAD(P)H-hydrate dehydratase [Clostridia bacterium]|nr:NAD(P)H-hydrate dehydratase [Clostridia bacterium]
MEKEITKEEIARLLPKRKRDTHKGCYGRAAIVAGSEEFLGAPVLATAACLRSGAGYTYLFTPIKAYTMYATKLPEAIVARLGIRARKRLLDFDALAIGMGMGASKKTAALVEWLLQNFTGRLVLDADALNALSAFGKERLADMFAHKKCDAIVTPHIKEFSRLTGESVQAILQNPTKLAKRYAKTWGVTVLLKSAYSVVTDGERVAVNRTGTAGQAKGGSGDLLSGLIAGLCAQRLSAYEGGLAGAYLAGKAAELAAEEHGEYSLLASDTITKLGSTLVRLRVAENADEQGDEKK